jgi:hypothetical protein
MSPTGAEIVEQLNQSMENESESHTDEEQEASEQVVVSEDTKDQKAESSSTKGNKESKGQKTTQTIPYSRFKEKVDEVAELTKKLEAVVGNAESSSARENELRERIQELESEQDILNRIRSLGDNEKYAPLVQQLDKVLRGIEDDVESGKKTEAEGAAEVQKLFSKHQDEMQEAFADQRADMLLENARMLSESILESLPETYDEGDKNRIADLLPDLVDWDAIEEDPGTMRDNIVEGYKQALVEYGEPRGALKARIKELEETESAEPERDFDKEDEEFVNKLLGDERLGKFKTDSDGNVTDPEMSEAEFNQHFADLMKRVNRR